MSCFYIFLLSLLLSHSAAGSAHGWKDAANQLNDGTVLMARGRRSGLGRSGSRYRSFHRGYSRGSSAKSSNSIKTILSPPKASGGRVGGNLFNDNSPRGSFAHRKSGEKAILNGKSVTWDGVRWIPSSSAAQIRRTGQNAILNGRSVLWNGATSIPVPAIPIDVPLLSPPTPALSVGGQTDEATNSSTVNIEKCLAVGVLAPDVCWSKTAWENLGSIGDGQSIPEMIAIGSNTIVKAGEQVSFDLKSSTEGIMRISGNCLNLVSSVIRVSESSSRGEVGMLSWNKEAEFIRVNNRIQSNPRFRALRFACLR
jgi:hypothetical protein